MSTSKKKNNLLLIPIIFILLVLPLISRIYVYNTNLSQFPWFTTWDDEADVFLYYKSICFIVTTVVMVFIIISKAFIDGKKPKFSSHFIPLGIYALMALLSSVFSDYASFSFNGIYEHFESIWVLLSYCIAAYYTFLFVRTEDDLKVVINSLLVGVCIMTTLGLSQAFSHDFYRTTLGKMSLLPSYAWDTLDNFSYGSSDGRVYMSLYNPNYVGYYVALVVPLLLALVLFKSKEGFIKGLKNRLVILLIKISGLLLILGLLYSLLKSNAKNGIVALAIAIFIMFIIIYKKLLKHKLLLVSSIICLFLGFFLMNAQLNNTVISSVMNMFTSEKKTYNLSSIKLNDDNVTIVYKEKTLVLKLLWNDEGYYDFSLTDENGGPISYIEAEDAPTTYYIQEAPFENIAITLYPIGSYMTVGAHIEGKKWLFTDEYDFTSYYYINEFERPIKLEDAESVFFTGRERIASGRGYLWSRTIPLLKDYFILGSGADTFSIVFPSNDYVGKHNSGYGDTIITKPHSLYLQMGVQTGVISLIAFLTFYIIYFIFSFRLYMKVNYDSYMEKVGLGIFIGTIGYMISGLVNDSTITVAPIFWVLIGLGISINEILSKQGKAK